MKYELVVAAEALQQLWETANRYREQSESSEVGPAWNDGLLKALESLKENPERCGLAHESDQFPYELHELHYGSGKRKTHRALFRIVENRVEVLSIRHHSQRDVSPEDF